MAKLTFLGLAFVSGCCAKDFLGLIVDEKERADFVGLVFKILFDIHYIFAEIKTMA